MCCSIEWEMQKKKKQGRWPNRTWDDFLVFWAHFLVGTDSPAIAWSSFGCKFKQTLAKSSKSTSCNTKGVWTDSPVSQDVYGDKSDSTTAVRFKWNFLYINELLGWGIFKHLMITEQSHPDRENLCGSFSYSIHGWKIDLWAYAAKKKGNYITPLLDCTNMTSSAKEEQLSWTQCLL